MNMVKHLLIAMLILITGTAWAQNTRVVLEDEYTLTIKYRLDSDTTTQLFNDSIHYLAENVPFHVTSPDTAGFTPNPTIVEGVMPAMDTTIMVLYTQNTYEIIVTSNPTNGGTASGGGNDFHYGVICTVTAIPNTGFEFDKWTEENNVLLSENPNYSFEVRENRKLFANFKPQSCHIYAHANPTGGGTINNNDSFSQNYNYGDICTLTATASIGYSFFNWTNEENQEFSTDTSYTFIVNSNRNLVANFTLNTYTIDVSAYPAEGGTVSGGGNYTFGQPCTVTAEANLGYTFDKWTEDGNQVSLDEEYTFTVREEHHLVANFTNEDYVIKAEVDPENSGTIEGTGGYNYNEECTLIAIPNPGYDFVNWTKGNDTISANDTLPTFLVTESATYIAHFQLKSYTVTVSATTGGMVHIGDLADTMEATFDHGERCTIHANAETGYEFVNWTENGDVVPDASSDYTFTVDRDRNLVANFEETQQPQFSISVDAYPSKGGSPYIGDHPGTPQSDFNNGETCTVHANPADGFIFTNWTENGEVVPDAGSDYTFTVDRDRNFVANFSHIPSTYTVIVSAIPNDGGSAYIGDNTEATQSTFSEGDRCTVNATEDSGFHFVNWTESDTIVSTSNPYTFSVKGNRNLVANFSPNPLPTYIIRVTASPTNGGNAMGGDTYTEGAYCTVTATPNDNYTFNNWTENGVVVWHEAIYSFTVNCSRNLVANFTYTPPTYTVSVLANPIHGGSPYIGDSQGTTVLDYMAGEYCTVHANPAAGFNFVKWTTEDGSFVSDRIDYPFRVTSNRNLVANFSEISAVYTITVLAEPEDAGQAIGGGEYENGDLVNLTAEAINLCSFVNWTNEEGVVMSTSPTYDFDIHSSGTFIAHFDCPKLSGETEVCNKQKYTYSTTSINDAFYDWSTTDLNANIEGSGNSVTVSWGTYNTQQTLFVDISRNNQVLPLELLVDVKTEIDLADINAPVRKEIENNKYLLIYSNPEEPYIYQWYKDGEAISGANQQYYYVKGGLPIGEYCVYLSLNKERVCGAFSPTVSIDHDGLQPGKLFLYPNPSPNNNEVFIENNSGSEVLLNIYSIDGRLLHSQTVTDNHATIGVRLPQGIYITYLTDASGFVKVEKLVIQ